MGVYLGSQGNELFDAGRLNYSVCLARLIGYVPQVLGQLTSVGEISPEAWLGRWRELRLCTDTYYVIVIEDTDLRRVVGEQSIHSKR